MKAVKQIIVADIGIVTSGLCLGMASCLSSPDWLMPTLFLVGCVIVVFSIVLQVQAYHKLLLK